MIRVNNVCKRTVIIFGFLKICVHEYYVVRKRNMYIYVHCIYNTFSFWIFFYPFHSFFWFLLNLPFVFIFIFPNVFFICCWFVRVFFFSIRNSVFIYFSIFVIPCYSFAFESLSFHIAQNDNFSISSTKMFSLSLRFVYFLYVNLLGGICLLSPSFSPKCHIVLQSHIYAVIYCY